MLQINIPDEVIELHNCYMCRNVLPKLQYSTINPENIVHLIEKHWSESKKDEEDKERWLSEIRNFLLLIKQCFNVLAVGKYDSMRRVSRHLRRCYDAVIEVDADLTDLLLCKIFDYEHFSSLNEFDALIEQLKFSFLPSPDCERCARYTSEIKFNDEKFKEYIKSQLAQYGFEADIHFSKSELQNWFTSTVIKDLRLQGFHNSLLKKMKIWTPYVFALYLDVRVCPYCNRQYITTLLTDDARTRADIDHFKPKSKYPWLALSLYNMVLSCKTCNSAFKGTSEIAWNPYTLNIAQKFRFECDFNCEGNEVIQIKVDNDDSHTKQYLNDFKIKEMMQNHVNLLKEYRQKKLVYSNPYMDSIIKNTQNLYSNREELKAAVFGYVPREEDIDKVALGKLHYDLAKEFELLND